MKERACIRVALLAGEIMLRNGAETYRVEDTINRILKAQNLEVVESFVTPTGIFITVDDPSIEMMTMVKRVQNRTTHLEKVALVNDLSRRFVAGQLSSSQALEELEIIQSKSSYQPHIKILSIGLAAAFFTIVFGGEWQDFLASGLIGSLWAWCQFHLEKKKVSNFFIDLVGGSFIGLFAIILTELIPLGQNLDPIIIGSIMPLVPGVAITNAIRDTIQGDLVAGNSRASEALLIAVSIAAGVGVVLKIYLLLIGGSI